MSYKEWMVKRNCCATFDNSVNRSVLQHIEMDIWCVLYWVLWISDVYCTEWCGYLMCAVLSVVDIWCVLYWVLWISDVSCTECCGYLMWTVLSVVWVHPPHLPPVHFSVTSAVWRRLATQRLNIGRNCTAAFKTTVALQEISSTEAQHQEKLHCNIEDTCWFEGD